MREISNEVTEAITVLYMRYTKSYWRLYSVMNSLFVILVFYRIVIWDNDTCFLLLNKFTQFKRSIALNFRINLERVKQWTSIGVVADVQLQLSAFNRLCRLMPALFVLVNSRENASCVSDHADCTHETTSAHAAGKNPSHQTA